MKVADLKTGSILSETSFFIVQSITNKDITVKDDLGNILTIGNPYVEKILNSADSFSSEEKKTMTELAELFINSPRIAMTVAFYKKDTAKTIKAFQAEKAAKIAEIRNARVSDIEGLLSNLIETPLSKIIPGELRVMKGRHYGHIDELGRIHFIDMEQTRDISKPDYDSRKREVDPRTIQFLIVNGVKYSLK